MMNEMTLQEVFNYRDQLANFLLCGEPLGIEDYQKVFREWQRWENLSRAIKTQFYNSDPKKTVIDKFTINKINFRYLTK